MRAEHGGQRRGVRGRHPQRAVGPGSPSGGDHAPAQAQARGLVRAGGRGDDGIERGGCRASAASRIGHHDDHARRAARAPRARLERALERAVAERLDAASAYPDGSSREKRRTAVARALESEVSAAPPSRLLALIGQALKWQTHAGSLRPGDAFDVFRGETRAVVDEEERCPTDLSAVIELGKKNHAEAVAASPDGRSLAVGSSDGFVEVYDWATGALRMDLPYRRACPAHDARRRGARGGVLARRRHAGFWFARRQDQGVARLHGRVPAQVRPRARRGRDVRVVFARRR